MSERIVLCFLTSLLFGTVAAICSYVGVGLFHRLVDNIDIINRMVNAYTIVGFFVFLCSFVVLVYLE